MALTKPFIKINKFKGFPTSCLLRSLTPEEKQCLCFLCLNIPIDIRKCAFCNHFFCKSCAVRHHKKVANKVCPGCGSFWCNLDSDLVPDNTWDINMMNEQTKCLSHKSSQSLRYSTSCSWQGKCSCISLNIVVTCS